MVVDKLHITLFQTRAHVHLRIVPESIQHVQSLDVSRAQRHGALEALRAFNVLTLVGDRQVAGVPVEHGDLYVRLGAGRDLAPAVRSDRI